jgi:molecular chaperone GrpE
MDDDKNKFDEDNPNGDGRDDEIHIEVLDGDDPPSVQPPASEIRELDRQLADLKKEKEEIYDRLLRKHADFENFRKRAERDKREFQQYAVADFVLELLPILDNFERALSHSGDESGQYKKGVELIYRQLRDLLEKRGLKAIETANRPFDPAMHEAILREERNDVPENTILDELQRGYFFRDRLLRPAMVKVSVASNSPMEEPQSQENGEPFDSEIDTNE